MMARPRLPVDAPRAKLMDVHRIVATALPLVVACGPRVGGADESASTSGHALTTSSSTSTTASTTTTSTDETPPAFPDFGDPPDVPICDGFICSHDLAGDAECDHWAQDC